MKLIKPFSEILKQDKISDTNKQIERANNICNEKETKITETSADAFVKQQIKTNDISLLEHGTVYLWVKFVSKPSWLINGVSVNDDDFDEKDWVPTLQEAIDAEKMYLDSSNAREFYIHNKDSKIYVVGNTQFITTNYKVLVENNRLRDLRFAVKETVFHEKRITLHFTCDKHMLHELMKYREFSINDSLNNKIYNEITYIIPSYLQLNEDNIYERLWDIDLIDYSSIISDEQPLYESIDYLLYSLQASTYSYFNLIKNGVNPQQATTVLPDAFKTEVVMSGFESDWQQLLISEKDNSDIISLLNIIKNETF